MATVRLNDRAVLTTEHAAMSYAWPPILVRDGKPYGPADKMPEDAIRDYSGTKPLGWPLTAAVYALSAILGQDRPQDECDMIHAFAR